ncbi:MAG: hypothetical protein ACRCTR_07280 [Actinomycetota bacterium]
MNDPESPPGLILVGFPKVSRAGLTAAHTMETPQDALDVHGLIDALGPGEHVIAVWVDGAPGGARRLAVNRALSLRRDVAVVEVGGSSTRAAALRLLVDAWAGYRYALPVAAFVDLVQFAADSVQTVTMMSSVARLTNPQPNVVHHAWSYLPWSAFTINANQIRRGCHPPSAAHQFTGPVLGSATRGGDDALRVAVEWAGPVSYVASPPPQASVRSRGWWAEVTVLPVQPEQMFSAWVDHLMLSACFGCGRWILPRSCLFCGHQDRRQTSRATSEHEVGSDRAGDHNVRSAVGVSA